MQYLIRIQNSVFIGDIGWASLRNFKRKIKKEIVESEDSIQFLFLGMKSL
ncbi:CRISPR-associated endonuclease Cas2 [Acidiplasma cupricumulans]|nr:CRISPR-associated endonuclease Cas2 [Acidiplasma cupricumulans]